MLKAVTTEFDDGWLRLAMQKTGEVMHYPIAKSIGSLVS